MAQTVWTWVGKQTCKKTVDQYALFHLALTHTNTFSHLYFCFVCFYFHHLLSVRLFISFVCLFVPFTSWLRGHKGVQVRMRERECNKTWEFAGYFDKPEWCFNKTWIDTWTKRKQPKDNEMGKKSHVMCLIYWGERTAENDVFLEMLNPIKVREAIINRASPKQWGKEQYIYNRTDWIIIFARLEMALSFFQRSNKILRWSIHQAIFSIFLFFFSPFILADCPEAKKTHPQIDDRIRETTIKFFLLSFILQ